MNPELKTNNRILVIDDNRAIHDDFRKILSDQDPLQAAEARMFGKEESISFVLDSAYQGEEGLVLVQRALAEGRPYALAFIDVRMPPGWDGVETTKRLWEICPDLQVVICTAYSDYSWSELSDAVGHLDRLLILKKPFDEIEVLQLARALTEKWRLQQVSSLKFADLEIIVKERTREIEDSRVAALNMMEDAVEARTMTEEVNETLRGEIIERKKVAFELARTHQELLESSRQAGMAEVATGVLHNVGNVLNSVNVASTCLAESLRKSKAANLSRVVGLLHEHEADLGNFLTCDAKGKQIPGYLSQLAEHLGGEQAAALVELAQLQKNIEHIRDIVTMQQSFAKMSGMVEMLSATDLVEDALKMNASGLARHDIQVVKEFGELPLIPVEKHKLLQILVNLVRNALQACDDSSCSEKKLTIRTTRSNGHVRIDVSDNGVGITPENLSRIFSHGFTTKKDGHGFGLHTSALAAKEMGGSLHVQSEGIGHGATFILELPLGPAGKTADRLVSTGAEVESIELPANNQRQDACDLNPGRNEGPARHHPLDI